jgi:hypothetical protein
MKIKIVTFYLLGTISLSSCISLVANYAGNRFHKRMVEAENNPSITSYSDNYHIYKTGRKFTYEVHQRMDSTSVDFKLDLIVLPMIKMEAALVKYLYHYDPKDIITLGLQEECPDSLDGACRKEITTIREGKNSIWVHPPRSKTLKILELATFPEIKFNTTEWDSWLYIPKGNWGEWEKTKFDHFYFVDSIKYQQDTIPEYYYVSSFSESRFGKNSNNYVFHVDSGFTEMHYKIVNEGTVDFKLVHMSSGL